MSRIDNVNGGLSPGRAPVRSIHIKGLEQVILQLARQDMPMMIVTHDMWFAKNIASRVIFCAGGVVVEDGPPEQVLGSPREERTREFIDGVFHIRH